MSALSPMARLAGQFEQASIAHPDVYAVVWHSLSQELIHDRFGNGALPRPQHVPPESRTRDFGSCRRTFIGDPITWELTIPDRTQESRHRVAAALFDQLAAATATALDVAPGDSPQSCLLARLCERPTVRRWATPAGREAPWLAITNAAAWGRHNFEPPGWWCAILPNVFAAAAEHLTGAEAARVSCRGPADPFLFRWDGASLDLSQADLQHRLFVNLWDYTRWAPSAPKERGQVLDDLYPDDDEADENLDGVRKQVNSKFARAGMPLRIRLNKASIWLEVLPD